MKRPVSLVIGIIILVLGIVGFSSYFKDYPIKFGGIKIGGGGNNDSGGGFVGIDDPISGNPGSGSGNGVGTQKGNYLYCYASDEKGNFEGIYMPYKNVVLEGEGVIKGVGIADLSRGSKEEWEGESAELCYFGDAYNCNISWNGNKITIVANMNVPEYYIGLTKSQIETKLNTPDYEGDEVHKVTCKTVNSAPKPTSNTKYERKKSEDMPSYTTNSATTSSNKTNKKAIEESTNVNSVSDSSTSNSNEKICFQLATGNHDSTRSESINYSFYCSKKIIKPKVVISIVGQSAKDAAKQYTEESYKKYLKEKFCDKYHLSNCTYTWIEGTKEVEMMAECKTNYTGLTEDTARELHKGNDNSIEESLESVCGQ